MAQIRVHNTQLKEWVQKYIKLGCPVALASIWCTNTLPQVTQLLKSEDIQEMLEEVTLKN